jgi:hypothetical protein
MRTTRATAQKLVKKWPMLLDNEDAEEPEEPEEAAIGAVAGAANE